jgi:hypothetical protein
VEICGNLFNLPAGRQVCGKKKFSICQSEFISDTSLHLTGFKNLSGVLFKVGVVGRKF